MMDNIEVNHVDLIGVKDGINRTFLVPDTSSLKRGDCSLVWNGLRLMPEEDYNIVDEKTIELKEAPYSGPNYIEEGIEYRSGDLVWAEYFSLRLEIWEKFVKEHDLTCVM